MLQLGVPSSGEFGHGTASVVSQATEGSAVVGIWARKEHESQHAIVGSHLRASDSTIKTLH